MSIARCLHRLADDHGYNDQHELRRAALLVQHMSDAHMRKVLSVFLHHLVDQNRPDIDAIQRFIQVAGLQIGMAREEGFAGIAAGIAGAGQDGAALATIMSLDGDFEIQQELRRALEKVGLDNLLDD